MKVSIPSVSSSHQTPTFKPQNPAFNTLLNQLNQVNQAYISLFKDDQYKSDILTKKHAASLYNKMCTFLDQGSTEERNVKKEQFSFVFRNFITKLLQEYVLQSLSKYHEDEQLIVTLIQKWEQFKKFSYFYTFLLKAADNHYQLSYKSYKNQGKTNKINSQQSIFPIPVLAIHYFETIVYERYKGQITRSIRQLISQQRQGRIIQREQLRSLFQIVYSCGLGELARIDSVKTSGNQTTFEFFLSANKQIEKYYTNAQKNPDLSFFNSILNIVIEDCSAYYEHLFEQKISKFGPHEDFVTVKSILQKQQQISQYYFFNQKQKNAYLNKIKQIIVVTNLQQRLTRQNSLKFCLQKFDFSSDQYLNEIKIFIDSIFKAKQQSIKILQNVIRSYLMENGNKLNEKINKRKQYMLEIVNLKKSINRIIDQLMHKNLNICIVRDQCFKKILDSIEASRSLAQFADFKIKQCIKNKISEAEFAEKTKDIFLILQNLVATDSFLIYHQQYLGRRLLEPLNQPKIDIEKFILRKIGERLGTVTISVHSLMIKDIQKSQDLSQNFNKQLPFARFKFSCRIISPPYWPDNINNNNLEIVLPQTVRIEAETVTQLYQKQFTRFLTWKVDKGNSLFEGTFESGKFRFQSENIFLMILLHISQGKNYQIRFWELLQKVTKQKQGTPNHLAKCIKVLIENGLVTRSNENSQENIQEGELISIKTSFKPGPNYKPNQPIIIKASLQMHKAMHETTVEYNKIIKQREKIVQAVLVKLLKHSHSTGSNKMTFEQLVKGVRQYDHLKNFQISQAIIKQRIEEIIARGYCERNATDRKIFHYIA